MTETVIAMLSFLVLGLGVLILLVRVDRLSKRVEGCELGNAKMEMEHSRWDQEFVSTLRVQNESPASESPKKVSWEPDDYKDLSDGTTGKIEKVFKENNFKDGSRTKHRRFDDDELSEVSHMLHDHELREYGG